MRDAGWQYEFFLGTLTDVSLSHYLNIRAHLSMKIILLDPDLERTSFGNSFFDPKWRAPVEILIF